MQLVIYRGKEAKKVAKKGKHAQASVPQASVPDTVSTVPIPWPPSMGSWNHSPEQPDGVRMEVGLKQNTKK